MRTHCRGWVVALAMALSVSSSFGETHLEKLEKGIYLEETVGDLAGAAQVYREILRSTAALRATLAEAQYRLADCLAKQGKAEEAVRLLDQLIVLYPDQDRFVDEARARLGELSSKAASEEDRAKASELEGKGWALWNERKYAEAERVFREGVAIDPGHSNLWNGLGWSLFHQGKREESKKAFLECIEHKPLQPGALNGLGWLAYGKGENDEAIKWWEKAIEASPYATASLSGLANLYMEQGDREKAAEYYTKWLAVEPDNPQAKAGLKLARGGKQSEDLSQLLEELDAPPPGSPPFEALNKIVKIGPPAVPVLIDRMKTSNNWQIPKALGAIGDEAAIEPLIEKLGVSDFSPMREVIVEALEGITDEKVGDQAENWLKWRQKMAVAGEPSKDLSRLLEELDAPPPGSPPFEALNKIVKIGSPAVPALIDRMKTSNNWQIPKALGAIGDGAAIEPLIEKLGVSDFSPMREVIVEALEGITGEKVGDQAEDWRKWWHQRRDMDEAYWGRMANEAIEKGNLIGFCDAELQRVYIRGETGHAYIDKITLVSEYEEMVEKTNPSAEQMQKYYEDALACLEEHRKPLYEWRVLHLLSAIAADLGKDDLALRHLEEARDSYPEKDYRAPSKHSYYQHMVNQAAGMIWDASGVAAAESFLLQHLADDPKCEYFFDPWWQRRYEKENLQDRFPTLIERVIDAYRKRARKFPAKKEQIDGYIKQLEEK